MTDGTGLYWLPHANSAQQGLKRLELADDSRDYLKKLKAPRLDTKTSSEIASSGHVRFSGPVQMLK